MGNEKWETRNEKRGNEDTCLARVRQNQSKSRSQAKLAEVVIANSKQQTALLFSSLAWPDPIPHRCGIGSGHARLVIQLDYIFLESSIDNYG